ncbi:phage head-tail adapter protein [Bacillus thuringiensis]|uniref:phage head-tail adapter protein n=1 Tax=Bacillus thuringiensis TaxID=1428 RepID=UPI000BEE8017|nr:phage head-tail adapter protein [Bacillus thuringiensis]EKS8371205.1 phage head-tail adapter protein [Bacillus cereus]MBG9492630.1 phage head-tail adapter protein [Bacillus thuringiensis]MBG9504051.1 phage head-tail adapter protein [Bacillus thuringiensis]MBG9509880.1 phage head-tail adapter protein [Bacillus thuringiensis]MBG9516651.1 phage head-tail adapter protein [Bacillus thuringiensis]
MVQKAYRETFNDGYLVYGYKKTERSEEGKRVGEIFQEEGRLAYQDMSIRDSDYQMVGVVTTGLDVKVKTLYPPSFKKTNKNKLKVKVDEVEYDVIKVDPDATKRYLYFYLQQAVKTRE